MNFKTEGWFPCTYFVLALVKWFFEWKTATEKVSKKIMKSTKGDTYTGTTQSMFVQHTLSEPEFVEVPKCVNLP